jgi:mRNA interferase RelE/StbE
MARYELRFKTSVAKDLRGIAKADVKRIVARISELSDEPRPPGAEKLAGHDLYRIRQGVYRIVYRIEDVRVVVEIIKVAHRREDYRKL